MNRHVSLIWMLVMVSMMFISCDEDEEVSPIQSNAEVTVTNTLQTAADPSQGGTGGVETPIEVILGVPDGTFRLTATVNDGVEFVDYLEGLYDINLSKDQITYNLVAPADHPIYSNFFRTIEANTFDRYYFEFTEPHNIESASADNSSVSLNVLSDTRIVVQIGEGFSFNPGSTFSITLN